MEGTSSTDALDKGGGYLFIVVCKVGLEYSNLLTYVVLRQQAAASECASSVLGRRRRSPPVLDSAI